MSSVIYTGDRSDRATSTSYLEKRIEINRAYSSADFDGWLFERLAVKAGEHILDVGCGSGAQTIPFAQKVGPKGSVSALDISADSIALLKSRVPHGANVQAVASDMNNLADVIANVFSTKTYSLAHSSYALYYSAQRLKVLDIMRGALALGGRCAIFTTDQPHGLVDLAARFSNIPPEIGDSLQFGPKVLRPYFEAHFRRFDIHRFHNVVTVPSADVLIEFYRQTTYYDAKAEPGIRAVVDDVIKSTGHFQYEKNGYLIVGSIDA
jgi:ubiquinone/menaquinone biosynthesis C-methylase UbiE